MDEFAGHGRREREGYQTKKFYKYLYIFTEPLF